MAKQITKTWLELQILSGGSTCQHVMDAITPLYPGLSDDTKIDALTWCEQFRKAKLIRDLVPSVIRLMTDEQKKELLVWAVEKLQVNLPAGWAKAPELDAKGDELIDYVNAATPEKKDALQDYSSSLVVNFGDEKERFISDNMKRVINITLAGSFDHQDVAVILNYLVKGSVRLSGIDMDSILNALLDKVEQIMELV